MYSPINNNQYDPEAGMSYGKRGRAGRSLDPSYEFAESVVRQVGINYHYFYLFLLHRYELGGLWALPGHLCIN